MKNKEFIHILECALRCADENITMVGFKFGTDDAIEVFYENDIVHSIPITHKSQLEILAETSRHCFEVQKTNDLEADLRLIDEVDREGSFEDWKESVFGQAEITKFLYYLYRMTPVEKDYIFGKMSTILLRWRSADNPFLQEDE